MKISVFVSFFLCFALAQELMAEDKTNTPEKEEKVAGHVVGSINNIKIPKELIKKMELIFVEEFKKSDPVRAAQLTNTEIMINSNRKYLNLTVEIYDPKGFVLDKPVEFKPPSGGGIIDLGQFIGPSRGNFYFKINAYLDSGSGYEEEALNPKVFFLSNGKERKVVDQNVGAGCNKFMDISSFYNFKISQSGTKLNSTNRRFTSIIGGSFFFVYAIKDELYLASLKIVDSVGEQYLCRN